MALPGLYGSFIHERQVDADLMTALRPKAVVVLDPSASKVAKIWKRVKDQNAYIVLRKWEWDDNDGKVYTDLFSDPVELGKRHANQWREFVWNMLTEGDLQRLELPPQDRLICHLVNEPNTNGWNNQQAINLYTASALGEIEALNRITDYNNQLGCFNFGEGHPAELRDGKPNWEPFAQSLALLRNSRHWVLLHEYYSSAGITDSSNQPWHVFRHRWAPLSSAYNVGIAEWGVEELVNRVMDSHHGWQSKLSTVQFAADYQYYCESVAPWVQWVSIFASNTPGWETFDPAPAKDELVRVSRRLWEGHEKVEPKIPPTPPPTTPPVVTPPTSGDKTTWERSIAFVLGQEGGLSTDPNDPGNYRNGVFIGTKYGISAAAHPGVDIVNLTVEQAKDIYREQYWIASGADRMAWPMCLAHFDLAVNGGVGRAQQAIAETGPDFIRYMAWRIAWYARLSQFELYGRAWIRRCSELMMESVRLV